ncbi:TetR/AcrR family transcriptional regulator [Amycolatopsis mongoliensis]|uniref:TetR/AcrR family transcriptional regulator n=1 Tax=Amycolatopsis mongoliensis TaxID=715475 RepID=A0A9Y2JQE4_9PSEU|nr:TetR/AcrR family transcriptional regulator [Amycolatopsis sp. 4-36]WIY01614.1 TetR/AcrR family transcriptional regulator [Amycolatopsis sp. 4-36]
MTTEEPRRQRLTRAEAKARTRKLLLEAAAQTFARKGYAGSSVEEIAEAAGFSIGALYSNFGNKEELFLELSTTYNADRIAEASEVLLDQDADPVQAVNEVSRLLVDAADKDTDFSLLQAEFWLYAVRNPQVLDQMATRMRTPRAALEQLVGKSLETMPAPAEATPKAVATIVAALFEGLVRQRRIDPDQVPEELFGAALRWLFSGIEVSGREKKVAAPAKRKPAKRPRQG